MITKINSFTNSHFVVICGIDGSGKTSILSHVVEKLPEWQITHWTKLCHIEDLGWAGVFRLGPHPADYIFTLSPIRRALFIATIIWSEYEELIKPLLEKGRSVLSDSYYYKFWAKERIYNQAHPIFYKVLDPLPKPHHVIMIDVDPEIACKRKPEFTSYETQGNSAEDRVNFQTMARAYLLEIIDQVPHTIIDGNQDRERIKDHVITLLSDLKYLSEFSRPL